MYRVARHNYNRRMGKIELTMSPDPFDPHVTPDPQQEDKLFQELDYWAGVLKNAWSLIPKYRRYVIFHEFG
jgi:hypothetical protein